MPGPSSKRTIPWEELSSCRALSLDAAGTLLHPAVPVAETYRRVAATYGHIVAAETVETSLPRIMSDAAPMRAAEATWETYWRRVVRESLGSDDPEIFAALYAHYARPDAWVIAPGAARLIRETRASGRRVGVISNWDTRLRPLLAALGIADCFDLVVVSGEQGIEKPDPRIFEYFAAEVGVSAQTVLHLGDSARADVRGARAAGCQALHFGVDVRSFDEVSTGLRFAPKVPSPTSVRAPKD